MRTNILIVFSLMFLVGCASMVNEGKLKPIVTHEGISPTEKSATIRIYYYSEKKSNPPNDASENFSIEHSVTLSEEAKKIAQKSKAFNRIELDTFSSEEVSVDGENSDFKNLLLNAPIKALKTDYYLDIVVSDSKDNLSKTMKEIFIFPSLLTLGFLPFYVTEKINLDLNIYNKTGELIKTISVPDEMIVWYWTPLILASSSKVTHRRLLTIEPNLVKGVEHLLDQALRSGMIK